LYLTDLSDVKWSFAAPYLVPMTENAPQREHCLREVFKALQRSCGSARLAVCFETEVNSILNTKPIFA
jgi:hypothetical protein